MKQSNIMRLDRKEFYRRIFEAVFTKKTMSAENAKILQKKYEDSYYELRPHEDINVSVQDNFEIKN